MKTIKRVFEAVVYAGTLLSALVISPFFPQVSGMLFGAVVIQLAHVDLWWHPQISEAAVARARHLPLLLLPLTALLLLVSLSTRSFLLGLVSIVAYYGSFVIVMEFYYARRKLEDTQNR